MSAFGPKRTIIKLTHCPENSSVDKPLAQA